MIEVLPADDKKTFREFLHFPFTLYTKDSFWVPPLLRDIKEQFSPHNPFFKHAEVAPFIAHSHGNVVGRIAAIYNEAHIQFHGEQAGFFGFFECIDEKAVAHALINTVKQWLRAKGVSLLRGPMNFSSNEEWGLLVHGYDNSPMLMMPYNLPYYQTLLEGCELTKAKDLFAYIFDIPEKLPEKTYRVANIAEKGGVKVRPLDMKSFQQEMSVFKSIYNSAWEKNWGFVPMTDEEIEYMAKKLKVIIVPELVLIAERKGKTIGFIMFLPDFNYVLKKLNGRLLPFGGLKALWYSRKIKNLRLLLFGITQGYRRRGVDALLLAEALEIIKRKGFKKIEFSWILEDNYPVQRIIKMVNGKLYKIYRIYETEM
ncbi:MAG: GNAT family N-acetyltransferase [Thermodesulfovibrionia bacterium]|nr:GNAT family N-acetyltransferase [Thermodesulfovibrionia bacterium]MCK5512329.1 GNAT family N-acetyltransferase [Thermodesulfovibrionia bacterium]